MEEQTIYEDKEFSYIDKLYNISDSTTEFIQNNGWYFLALVILLAYFIYKFWPHYIKWSKQRAEDAYEAEIKKNPDLFKQKQEELQKARLKFQEEYEKKAKIAIEKQKEKDNKILEEKKALLNNGTTGQTINKSEKSKYRPDYNPLMGSGSGSNYRRPRRSPCSGGGCG